MIATAPTLPPALVIELWNRVAEDHGTLGATLPKFAVLLLAESNHSESPNSSTTT
ncbi:MAG TPA: hypothetical protein VNE83_03120 [Terriglobales bacterium]|nr:hypothetical protein [Terriglobales bacterium]